MRPQFVPILLLLLSTGASLPAQTRLLSTIRGQVVAPGRVNNAAIEVSLEKAPNRLMGRVITDSGGSFEFLNLEAGRYEVVVNLEGYLEGRQTVDIESAVQFQTEPLDGDQAVQRAVVDTGVFNPTSGVYIVLSRIAPGSSSDPDIVALSRKYPKKLVQEYQKAQDDMRKGNAAKAAERLEAVLKDAPDFYAAHNDLGGLYQKQQRYRDAEQLYKRAKELNGQSALALINLGGMYLQEADANLEKNPDGVGGILDEALDALEEAISREPHAAPAYYLLGTAYFRSAFYEEAEDNLKHALTIEPALGSARLVLINVYLSEEKWQPALEQLDLYMMKNPNASNRAELEAVRLKVAASLGRDAK